MGVKLRPVESADRPTLRNLLQLYLHDFSEYDGSQIEVDGSFAYPQLPRYWENPDRHAYLIMADEKLAGFVLIKKWSELADDAQAMDVAEFFVLRGRRRHGIGREAFRQVVRKFPGSWLVSVMESIPSALAFWESAISDVAVSAVRRESRQDGDRTWSVFRFAA